MIRRLAVVVVLVGLGTIAVAAFRHLVRSAGRRVPGGMLIADPAQYDTWSHRLLFGSLFGPVAADVARSANGGAQVLEVGSGPGHLAVRLAAEHGFEVTGLDLDPAMVERARTNAASAEARATFMVGDAAALPFPDASFDLVVSTMSMHHWAKPAAGIAEISRVLRPGGRALIWDFRSRRVPLHRRMPERILQEHAPGLEVVSVTPWSWPWRFHLLTRSELLRSKER